MVHFKCQLPTCALCAFISILLQNQHNNRFSKRTNVSPWMKCPLISCRLLVTFYFTIANTVA